MDDCTPQLQNAPSRVRKRHDMPKSKSAAAALDRLACVWAGRDRNAYNVLAPDCRVDYLERRSRVVADQFPEARSQLSPGRVSSYVLGPFVTRPPTAPMLTGAHGLQANDPSLLCDKPPPLVQPSRRVDHLRSDAFW